MQLLLAILLVYVATFTGCQAASSNEPTKPQAHFDIGNFLSLDMRYNETRSENKLRLSKSYLKYVISGGIQEKIPIGYMKYTLVEELINCNNLTLLSQDYDSLIDCKPAQAHLAKRGTVPTGTGRSSTDTYVKSLSLYNRMEYKMFQSTKMKLDLTLYPLQEDIIQEYIESASVDLNLGKLDRAKPKYKLGYYFEYMFEKDSPLSLDCHGEVLLSINKSKIETFRYGNDFPEWMNEIHSIINHAIEHGYILSLQNVVCEKPGMDLFALKTDFTIAQRQEFPYLAVKHTSVSYPLDLIFNYKAIVQQERFLEIDDAYNTSISITSRAVLGGLFNFDLNQEFVNFETKSGFENMKLTYPQLALLVDSFWNENDFVKNVNLYIRENTNWLDKPIDYLTDAMQFQYANLKKSEHVVMTLKVLRALIPSIGNFLPLFDTDESFRVYDNVDPQDNHDEL